jgi:FkbM family methyltransferase
MLSNFDYYFEGVIPSKQGKKEIVDYSKPAWHDVKNFDLMPIYFNSMSEPTKTINAYVELSEISEGSVVIDLGAYSALTSIIFDQRVGQTGLVVAIEADRENYLTCVKNSSLYEKITKKKIHLVNAAIWRDTNGIIFSSEGTMGSSVVDIIGNDRAENIFVNTVTLMSLANDFKLERVDFIKCDIEGAESVALNAPDFFNKYKPRIVIECHIVDGVSTEYSCRSFMENFGYTCTLKDQEGYPLKLLFCHPK